MATVQTAVTSSLASYALTLRYEDIPQPVVQRTKDLLLDFLAVALGGRQVAESTAPIIAGVKDLAQNAGGTASVIGEAGRMPPHYAALLNTTLAHSMDYDDTHRVSIMHPGAPLFATLLALGEDRKSSGKEFLAAAVAGYDIGNKIGKAHGPSMHHRGFHPSATTGIFACTAAGARLLGLSQQQTESAMGLNISQIAGSQQFLVDGSWNKRLHVGLAAHNAILSLVMARHGYKGSKEPIEGRFGYFTIYADDKRDPSLALHGLGREFEVMETAVKPYPCCRYNHATIDAVRDMVSQNKLRAEDVAAIKIAMGETGFKLVGQPVEAKRRPTNIVEGQFSIHFAAACAVLEPYTWDSYRLLGSPDVEKLTAKVTAVLDASQRGMGSRITLTTRDGREMVRDVPLPKGEPENPMSWQEMRAKFEQWAPGVLGKKRSEVVAGLVSRLETLDDTGALMAQLRKE
ncbi:MAG: MmgE/PrpD family protein [Dehalococcoidia bacterium]|nr:MmgE/PrpD family protein [Dehalococcoidia bacterium]